MALQYGIQPFWFWNGEMKDEELRRQIGEMADKGVRGFFIHPRQGLTVPYLSEEWFSKVGLAIEEAKRFGMEVWLYDEYPYPSGVSGGQVILDHPEYEAKALERKSLQCVGEKRLELDLPWGQVVHAMAYPVQQEIILWDQGVDLVPNIGTGYAEKIFQMSGLTAFNRKRFFTGKPVKRLTWQAPGGTWHIEIFIQTAVDHFKYFGKFVDPLNKDAVAYYLQTTHEQYRRHFSDEFGHTIKGIFTDEVTAFPGEFPWSPTLEERFVKQCGYSLVRHLPALFQRMGEQTDRIRYDYWRVVTDAFIESYEIQVRDWCRKNSLLYAGEKPILRSSQLQYFDIPGIDNGHQKAGMTPDIVSANYRGNGKIASSAAHFYHKAGTLCECFHSIGWGMTLQDMKWTIDWLAVQGVNWFVPHGYFYTTNGLTKHDAPPSSFFQMPYWKDARQLSRYADLLSDLFTRGKRRVEVLVLDSVTSQWTAMGEKAALKERIARDFSMVQRSLLENHVDFYVVDPELLGQSVVRQGTIGINDEWFPILVLPPLLNLEKCAWSQIEAFINQGGTVIAVGCLPIEQIESGEPCVAQASQWFDLDAAVVYQSYLKDFQAQEHDHRMNSRWFTTHPREAGRIAGTLVTRESSIEAGGSEVENILSACCHIGDDRYFFLTNLTDAALDKVNVHLNTSDISSPVLYKVLIDRQELVPMSIGKQHGDILSFSLSFAPFESYLLKVTQEADVAAGQQNEDQGVVKLTVKGQWERSLLTMNALRLADWQLEVSGVPGSYAVSCQPIIDQVAESGMPLPVLLHNYFGCPKEMRFPPLTAHYKTVFSVERVLPVFLVLEPESIGGNWVISVNGRTIKPQDFTTQGIYLPDNLTLDITSDLKEGENTLEVYVETQSTFDGLVNPLYLFGEFAATKQQESWVLTSLEKLDAMLPLKDTGLPFYGGTIVYTRWMSFDLDSIPAAAALELEGAALQDSVRLVINGHDAGTRAWSPYRWEVPKSWLLPQSRVELHISTTLLGLFEGEYYDDKAHRYQSIE